MGSNRRHGESIARARANTRAELAALVPLSLTPDQLGDEPVTQAREVIPVRAWVLVGATALQVEGVAIAWTSRAVRVRWPTDTDVRSAWIWASACERVADA